MVPLSKRSDQPVSLEEYLLPVEGELLIDRRKAPDGKDFAKDGWQELMMSMEVIGPWMEWNHENF